MRRLGTVAFAVLAGATVAAFFVTQHLKVSDPLISGYPHTSPPVISPAVAGCGGRFRATRLSFYLQHRADDVSVAILRSGDVVVRRITSRRHMARNVRSLFTWDGRTDGGAIAPDGTYTWRIVLLGQDRTIQIASPIKVRDVPPQPRIVSVTPVTLPQPGTVTIRFSGVAAGDRATAQIYWARPASRPRLLLAFLASGHDRAVWNGRIHGRPASPGTYLIGLTATGGACGNGRFPPAGSPPVRVGPQPSR
ncbi:MAG TPA: FlgD immunoglobulin-like domain containing protein [Solirubrobacteraceae bacterium]|nr:FlgD immunoglobulin-like domain containing protein [Solirubrobacteraceae bacterium]